MKFVALTLLAFVAAVIAGPVSISDNNVGDIVTVGISANAELSNKVDQTFVNVILALLNQQAIVAGDGNTEEVAPAAAPEVSKLPELNITPEMIEKVKSFLKQN
jgi:hypothetical protein